MNQIIIDVWQKNSFLREPTAPPESPNQTKGIALMNDRQDFANIVNVNFDDTTKMIKAKLNRITKSEVVKINTWAKWLENIWVEDRNEAFDNENYGDRLILTFGETDEGDGWVTVMHERTGDACDVDTTLAQLWISIEEGQRVWNYRCEPRNRYFSTRGSFQDLMVVQMPAGLYETLIWDELKGEQDVVQFV